MSLSQLVESYRFWEVVTHWARESLEHEETVARALARAVICDGLVLNSVDKRWPRGDRDSMELKGYPYVGYSPVPGDELMVLRADALSHLLSIVQKAESPSREILSEEFIVRENFKRWLVIAGQTFPAFWFSSSEVRGR